MPHHSHIALAAEQRPTRSKTETELRLAFDGDYQPREHAIIDDQTGGFKPGSLEGFEVTMEDEPVCRARKTHLVKETLGDEAQLIDAAIQSSGSIKGRFHYECQGKGAAMQCRVAAVLRGEKEIMWDVWLSANSVTTKNSSLWKTNPKQQLGYQQVKNGARLYCPGSLLGVYSPRKAGRASSRTRRYPTGRISRTDRNRAGISNRGIQEQVKRQGSASLQPRAGAAGSR
ncbi:recombinase RecT [Paludibacterium yongneupense]|uniref:recombinase RecT n=1 Tax=Paludibacterium yongneupense TaxID=400061 RepID=UPI00048C36E0|nr:recombinase RecT [Paludibacterium yongneupense]